MKLRSIFVFTHDSIGLGEDGPTHQSIEHAASLRLIPHIDVWRPCDTVETAVAWAAAIERADGPVVPPVHAAERAVRAARRGADRGDPPRRLRARRLERREREARGHHRHRLGSRHSRWARATALAARRHRRARRVDAVHAASSTARTPRTARACCRAACRASRSRPAPPTAGASTSAPSTIRAARSSASTRFGESAPAGALFKHFGFTVEHVVAAVRRVGARRVRADERLAHPPRDAPTTRRRSRACASTAGARTYRGLIPDAYLDGMQVDASTALWDRVLTAGAEHRRACSSPRTTADVVGFAAGNRLAGAQARARRRARRRSTCGASSSAPASAGAWSAPSSTRSARTARPASSSG